MKILRKISEFLKSSSEGKISIKLEKGIFSYYDDSKLKSTFSSKDVLEIFAFKRDLFTVDLICIGFRIDTDGSFHEIDEELEGYKEVLNELPHYFSGIKNDWFSDVAFPAFETNCKTIWGEELISKLWEEQEKYKKKQ